MSMKLVVRIMHEVDLPRGKQLVLMGMAENADDDGKGSRPSVDRIAWKANYKWRQVLNIMAELEKDKIIEKVKEASQHRAAEWDIHIEKAPQKMPFEEWRKIHGRYKDRYEKGVPRDAENAPLDEGAEDGSGVQFENPGVQNGDPGVQFDDPRGATASAPEPLNRSNEPLNEPGAGDPPEASTSEKKNKGRGDRSKPTAPDYRSKVEAWLAANEDLSDEVRDFIAREAAKNDSGEMTYSRQWRSFVSPVKDALASGADPDAVLYALQEANRMKAKNMSYFERVLENNPNGKPRRGGSSGPSASSGRSGDPVPISGKEGAARRREDYEDFFGEKPAGQERGVHREPEPAPMPEPDPEAIESWEAAIAKVEEEHDVDADFLKVWFDGGVPAALGADGAVDVVLPNSFAKEYLGSRFGGTFEKCSVALHTAEEWAARAKAKPGERKAS